MTGGTRRVLYVEDDELNRVLMEHVVALMPGWTMVIARSLADARSIIDGVRADAPALDLVLVDLDLPDGSGDELLADLRRLNINAPVWAVTGDASTATAERLATIGIGRVVVKPFDIAALVAAMADLG